MKTLTVRDIQVKLQLGRTSIYRLIKSGQFPAAVSITGHPGQGSARWLETQVDDWIAAKFGSNQQQAHTK